jgi:hypothetical protein
MSARAFLLVLCVVAASSWGCAKHGTLEPGGNRSVCGVEIVFSQSTTSYDEGAMPEDPFWTGVEVSLSDSTFDFGYLNDLGNFIHLFSGKEGSFEAGGGQIFHFALREGGGHRNVYGIEKHGACKFAGAQIQANKAILPARTHDYHSSVEIVFDVPGRREVTVILASHEPNGFAPSED